VAELKDVGLSQAFPRYQQDKTSGSQLVQRAADTLVVNHLRCNSYSYTLSIFQPECGLSNEMVKKLSICIYYHNLIAVNILFIYLSLLF